VHSGGRLAAGQRHTEIPPELGPAVVRVSEFANDLSGRIEMEDVEAFPAEALTDEGADRQPL